MPAASSACLPAGTLTHGALAYKVVTSMISERCRPLWSMLTQQNNRIQSRKGKGRPIWQPRFAYWQFVFAEALHFVCWSRGCCCRIILFFCRSKVFARRIADFLCRSMVFCRITFLFAESLVSFACHWFYLPNHGLTRKGFRKPELYPSHFLLVLRVPRFWNVFLWYLESRGSKLAEGSKSSVLLGFPSILDVKDVLRSLKSRKNKYLMQNKGFKIISAALTEIPSAQSSGATWQANLSSTDFNSQRLKSRFFPLPNFSIPAGRSSDFQTRTSWMLNSKNCGLSTQLQNCQAVFQSFQENFLVPKQSLGFIV